LTYKVVIPQDITMAGKKYLNEKGYDVVIGTGSMERIYLKSLLKDADAILARTGLYPSEVLSAATKLKVIGRHGVGYDNIDLAYCKANNILVTYTPAALTNAVAERTLGFIMGISQQLAFMDAQLRKGDWKIRNTHKWTETKGKVLGLIGMGRIGTLVAKKAFYGLDMEIIIFDEYLSEENIPSYVTRKHTVEEVLKQADFVSLHAPSTPETEKIINTETLKMMKPSSYVINCSRGELIEEIALVEALKNGGIKGAAIDVFSEEPPLVNHPFFKLDNILLSPHNAALSKETMDIIGLHAAQGIHDVLSEKEPEWPITF